MPRLPRGQFSLLALVTAMASLLPSARGAELPPFAVDPELLGLPAAKPVETPAPSPAVKKVEPPVAVQSSAPATPTQAATTPAPAAPPVTAATAPANASPATVAANAATVSSEPQSVAEKKPAKRNKKPKVSDAPVLAAPAINQAAPAAVAATANPVVPPTPGSAPAVPSPAAPANPVPSAGVARNMAVFKVDPALLGLPAEAEVTATAVARPSGTATSTVPAAVAAQGGAAPVRRRKGELVPGQVMPESAVAANTPSPGSPAAKPAMGLAQNMPVFRVDPALLDPADRVASPVVVAATTAPDTAAKTKTGPSRKISVVPGVVAGGTYFPPVYAGSAKDRKTVPVYVTADQMEGISGVQAIARGNADLIKADSRLRGDEIIYREQDDEVEATGNVILTREGDEVAGPHLKLKLGDSIGYFDSPKFKVDPRADKIKRNEAGYQIAIEPPMAGYGTAAKMNFLGEDHYSFDNATYSTCVPGEDGQAWFAKVADLNLDYETNIGEAHDATLVFKGIPILYAPSLSFSLNRQRKSGFLAPTWGSTTNGGIEVAAPYYWNIAPEMDATITPRAMAKRGTQWRGEYRYMGRGFTGMFNGEYLPNDKIAHKTRTAFSFQHNQISGPFSGSLNLNGVSDDTYFTDMASQITTIAQTNLVREGRLSYGGGWWSASTLIQRYQTLQDPAAATVLKPYERLPQVTLTASRPDLPLGLAFNFSGEYVAFSNPDKSMVQGTRTTFYPQISLPLQTSAFYLTPKIGTHTTRYQLSNQAIGVPDSMIRSVPIFSVDSGVVFEREANYLGRDLIQTLEPRLYYLNVPLRDQSKIPVFDTGVADYNFAQIFAENSFSGGDRIADANQATLAVSSRFISPVSGTELAKVAIGQRWYFSDQSVTLPNVVARTGHMADYLGGLTAQLEQNTAFDGALQYNPRDKRLERLNLGVRYQPETGRIMNAGYRYSSNLLRQVDLSGQWPLGGGWSGVGRFNYSLRDKRIIENIAGLEYSEACWAVRFVMQKVATATGQSSTGFFVQLQLNGFSSLGTNVTNLLQRSVTGYGRAIDGSEEELSPR